jgi:hypothetical protein
MGKCWWELGLGGGLSGEEDCQGRARTWQCCWQCSPPPLLGEGGGGLGGDAEEAFAALGLGDDDDGFGGLVGFGLGGGRFLLRRHADGGGDDIPSGVGGAREEVFLRGGLGRGRGVGIGECGGVLGVVGAAGSACECRENEGE